MTPTPIKRILSSALPGKPLEAGHARTRFGSLLRSATDFWVSSGKNYAVFLVIGDHVSTNVQEDIKSASQLNTNPVVILVDYAAVTTFGSIYRDLNPFVVAEIAGTWVLIPPHTKGSKLVTPARPSPRIPLDLIDHAIQARHLPARVITEIKRLRHRYSKFPKKKAQRNDDHEESLLAEYASGILVSMGLKAKHAHQPRMIRLLEGGGRGARRDHFFHSFQNYFFGLKVIDLLDGRFRSYLNHVRLGWNVEPHDVWFLTSIWHDVGYQLQNATLSFGIEGENESDPRLKREFLESPTTIEAIKRLSSLIGLLMSPSGQKTPWMMPDSNTHLGGVPEKVSRAVTKDVMRSHGAIGALQLYKEFKGDLDDSESQNSRDLLLQTVLVAGASMPFHDYWFRRYIREELGICRINTSNLPFGALLSFIDSIQDDRRELQTPVDANLVLEGLIVTPPATVSARINQESLSSIELLRKLIEARDVHSALEVPAGSLIVEYPEWLIPRS